MKKTDWHYILFVIVLLLLIVAVGNAQASCTIQNPCVQLPITNPNTLPGATVMWSCVGSAASCTSSALNVVLAQQTPSNLCPAATSVWHCNQFSQTKTPQAYNDPQPYNTLLNYAFQGTNGGGVSAASPVLVFQMPQAPPQPPSVPAVLSTVTSGSAGPQ